MKSGRNPFHNPAPLGKKKVKLKKRAEGEEPYSKLPPDTSKFSSPGDLLVTNSADPSGGLSEVVDPNVVVSEVGKRSSNGGKLHIFAIAVGVGNGCLVITPDNELYIVDLGTYCREREYPKADGTQDCVWELGKELQEVTTYCLIELLFNSRTLAQNKKIKGVILSHSDGDHYNLLSVLEAMEATVEQIYFSNLLCEYSVPTKSLVKECIAWKSFTGGGKAGRESMRVLTGSRGTKSGEAAPTSYADHPLRTLTFTGYVSDGGEARECSNPYVIGCKPPAVRALSLPKSTDGVESAVRFDIPIKSDPAQLKPVPYVATKEIEGVVSAPRGVTLFSDSDTYAISALVSNYSTCFDYATEGAQDFPRVGKNLTYPLNSERNPVTPKFGAVAINRCSIVTCIDCAGEVCVICGDANGSTEGFLLENYSEKTLGNVDYLCIPHHGSTSHGSSGDTFAKRMSPKTLVVSTARVNTKFSHPEKTALCRYIQLDTLNDEDADVSYSAFSDSNRAGHLVPVRNANAPNYFQFSVQKVRLYHTGWLSRGWHHYEVQAGDYNVEFNNNFKPPMWRNSKTELPVNVDLC